MVLFGVVATKSPFRCLGTEGGTRWNEVVSDGHFSLQRCGKVPFHPRPDPTVVTQATKTSVGRGLTSEGRGGTMWALIEDGKRQRIVGRRQGERDLTRTADRQRASPQSPRPVPPTPVGPGPVLTWPSVAVQSAALCLPSIVTEPLPRGVDFCPEVCYNGGIR